MTTARVRARGSRRRNVRRSSPNNELEFVPFWGLDTANVATDQHRLEETGSLAQAVRPHPQLDSSRPSCTAATLTTSGRRDVAVACHRDERSRVAPLRS